MDELLYPRACCKHDYSFNQSLKSVANMFVTGPLLTKPLNVLQSDVVKDPSGETGGWIYGTVL